MTLTYILIASLLLGCGATQPTTSGDHKSDRVRAADPNTIPNTWEELLEVSDMVYFGMWKVNTRQDGERSVAHLQKLLEQRSTQLRDVLHAFKLEVAKHYASQGDLRDLEGRLTSHLLRIESKLDSTALKAEVANSKTNKER